MVEDFGETVNGKGYRALSLQCDCVIPKSKRAARHLGCRAALECFRIQEMVSLNAAGKKGDVVSDP